MEPSKLQTIPIMLRGRLGDVPSSSHRGRRCMVGCKGAADMTGKVHLMLALGSWNRSRRENCRI